MLPIGQEHIQAPCPYKLPHIFIQIFSLALGLALTTLTLLLIQRIARRHYQPTQTHPATLAQPDQTDTMEKGTLTSPIPGTSMNISPPPATACDVLKPLSQSGAFPSSGAVAARARELMQMQPGKASPSSPEMDATVMAMVMARALGETEEGSSETCGSVQKRSESAREMREVDGDGLRTWRRVVTEYS
jgi:hypothetical protein